MVVFTKTQTFSRLSLARDRATSISREKHNGISNFFTLYKRTKPNDTIRKIESIYGINYICFNQIKRIYNFNNWMKI